MNKKGFSLIELMVVVSIMGILMALGAVSYTTAQKKARDASRKGDMRALQDALEQYYVAEGSTYPTDSGCSALTASNDYLPGGLPQDPKPSQSYAISCDDGAAPLGDYYCACATLESDVGNSGAGCTFGAATTHFCVTNQQ